MQPCHVGDMVTVKHVSQSLNVVMLNLDEKGTTLQNKQTDEYNSLQKETEKIMLRKHAASCKLCHGDHLF